MKRDNVTLQLDLHGKLIVDLFAGGGGMSSAFEMAWGRSPDIAINHNDDALSLHRLNHPQTRHFIADVFEVDPRGATQGRPVGWLHLSPDCTHHSQAAGGQPRSAKIRGLAWVGPRWGGQKRPDVISLENVKQILQWGPLIAKRDKATGRVLKLDGTVAAIGERVPVQQQYLIPDPKRAGRTWRKFVRILQAMGYEVQTRIICAADMGGHTTRERLFMIARCDGQPILWDEPTHQQKPEKGQRKWKPVAEVLEFSIPCRSIFGRSRELADATKRRIARGIVKFVLNNPTPYIIQREADAIAPIMTECANASTPRCNSAEEPLRTICAQTKGGHHALIAPVLVQTGYGERDGQAPRSLDIEQPLGTVVGSGKHAIAAAYMMQANGGYNTTNGRPLDEPMTTITNTGSQQQLVTAHLAHFRGNCDSRGVDEPLRTISAAGLHHGFIECTLSEQHQEGAVRVAAFLMRYYGEGGQWSGLDQPLTTIKTKDRMALVTVTLRGRPYMIVDIGMRMLEPPELFAAQDFPPSYIIDRGHDGRRFSKAKQTRFVGNSVDPLMAVGFLRLNAPHMAIRRAA